MTKSKSFYARTIVPLAKALDKDKWKGFVIMYSFWLTDLATTAIALGLFGNELFEGNPVAASFFGLGIYGWFAWMFAAGLILLGVLFLPSLFYKIATVTYKRNASKRELSKERNHYAFCRLINISIIVIGETIVIGSNIKHLINVI